MAWLRKLLGMTAKNAEAIDTPFPLDVPNIAATPDGDGTEARHVTIKRYGDHIVGVPQIDFMGQCDISPNGRFTLLWSDRSYLNDDLVGGRYVLVDGDEVVINAAMARPQDGKVTDNGVFILNDWGGSEDLAGTFHAFAADGRPLVTRSFAANLLNNGLSPDGRLAVSQTCNAPNSPDSSVLCVFDLVAGEEIGCWSPQSGWAGGYEFPAGGERIRMLRRDREPIDYSLKGDFIDQRKWFAEEVRLGTLNVIKEALRAGEEITGLTLEELRQGAGVAIADEDTRFRAGAFRLLGEIEEQAGDPAAALAAYREALEINPKVGVAKRAAALTKSVDSRPQSQSMQTSRGDPHLCR